VKRIHAGRPRVLRERPWREDLPSDAGDPDVVRVKALARARDSRRPDGCDVRPADAAGLTMSGLNRPSTVQSAGQPARDSEEHSFQD
jgi:hypothetical protein